jgi:CHAT domain-containing protein
VVHVSAHAIANPLVPTRSLLLLADGAMSVASLATVPLRGALLVLSACSSASGEARSGEGEIGLLGWPYAAGARGAVAALWSVNQQATMDLMGQFHAIRAEGYDEVEAMRAARATLASSANYAHPFYWAGFGVFSAPRTTVPTPRPRWEWLVAALLALGSIAAIWFRRGAARAVAPASRTL